MSKNVPVKLEILELIALGAAPLLIRVDSLVRDYYCNDLKLSSTSFVSMLDIHAAAHSLTYMLDEFITQAKEANVDTLHLAPNEYTILLELSKAVETSLRSKIGCISLRAH
jgi:hypothetical protein